jgi:hypothetical protein
MNTIATIQIGTGDSTPSAIGEVRSTLTRTMSGPSGDDDHGSPLDWLPFLHPLYNVYLGRDTWNMTWYGFVDFQLIALNHGLDADSASKTEKGDGETVMYYCCLRNNLLVYDKNCVLSHLTAGFSPNFPDWLAFDKARNRGVTLFQSASTIWVCLPLLWALWPKSTWDFGMEKKAEIHMRDSHDFATNLTNQIWQEKQRVGRSDTRGSFLFV